MSPVTLDKKRLQDYRNETFCLTPKYRVKNAPEALEFINKRGFVFFWPVKGVDLPSLWTAHAGDIPVADEHDHPGHHTWGWKDDALDKSVWYYAKILRRKSTFISLQEAPAFYALSPNYGDPDEDYIIQYREGKLPLEAKQIFETLLKEGPLNTISLRKLSHLSQPTAEYLFNRNMDLLQSEMKVLPVGIAEAGSWNYSYIYDLTHRHFPQLPLKAGEIPEKSARKRLVLSYLRSVGCASRQRIISLFNWSPALADRALTALAEEGNILSNVQDGDVHALFCIPELVQGA